MTTVVVGTGGTGQYGQPYRLVRNDQELIEIIDFDISHFGKGLVSIEAIVDRLVIGNGRCDEFYRIVTMNPGSEIKRFHIYDVTATNLGRGCLRFYNAHDGLVENVHATYDGIGDGDIPVGFAVNNGLGHTITYRDCTAVGFRQTGTKPGQYVNGDGFSDEETQHHMVYEDCVALDNADSGFDIKSIDSTLTRCTAEGSRRNFRGHFSGTWTDCRSVDPDQAHFQFASRRALDYTLVRPVFIGGEDKPHLRLEFGAPGSRIVVIDPILPAGEELRVQRMPEEDGNIEVVVQYTEPPPEPEPQPEPAPEPRTLPVQITVDGITYAGTLTETI